MVAYAGAEASARPGPRSAAGRLLALVQASDLSADPVVRQHLMTVWSAEYLRSLNNLRVTAGQRAGRGAGPVASVGKALWAKANQDVHEATVDLLGAGAMAWEPGRRPGAGEEGSAAGTYAAAVRREVRNFLRSRATSIEGGSTEVNNNILAERVLGLPREPDPWKSNPWSEVPPS